MRLEFECAGHRIIADFPIPPENYQDGKQFREWLRLMRVTMQHLFPKAILDSATITAAQAAYTVTSQMGISSPDKEDFKYMIDSHSKYLVREAKKRMHISGPGRPPIWTKETLEKAANKAAARAAKVKYRAPRLQDVAEVLNKRYPSQRPLTGNSLRMLLKRYEVDWKTIKNAHI
jgi:hypothetical protein